MSKRNIAYLKESCDLLLQFLTEGSQIKSEEQIQEFCQDLPQMIGLQNKAKTANKEEESWA